ncbi:peptidyl-prolyl cis-trans isomerase FKBP42-like [Phoenix dactylifera]|uniref:peptidylprolyl isomerase n=1 Tax=Phoenix dactylifera TaxID=42345 RepID=A0A8B9A1R8_PHODC|nr:peptidyl-prolyl cis-trans isomerase FKBP42-like [Phoenix dactylifera]
MLGVRGRRGGREQQQPKGVKGEEGQPRKQEKRCGAVGALGGRRVTTNKHRVVEEALNRVKRSEATIGVFLVVPFDVAVHYRAWVENSSHKFEDTWQEQRPVELILGKEKTEMTGLGIGVASMKSGEHALLHVGWELGYGKEGSFSFPNVPPMADLLYEVELIGYDEAKEGKARSDMTVEEIIQAADGRKMEGNSYFKEEKLQEAMQQYEMAIAYMGDDFMFQLFGKYRDMALAVKNPCHLNMAACLIKLNQYKEAIGQCSIVLSEDENNVKALYRRGKARAQLGQTDAAREDFQKARKFAPEDKAIVRELQLLAEHDKAVYQKQKEIYKGIFGPRPEPKPKRLSRVVVFWQWLVSLICSLFKRRRPKTD